MSLTHVNPESIHASPAFSQGVLIEPGGGLLVVGGQNGVDANDDVVDGGIGEQTAQAFRNVLAVLAEVGANQADVAKLTIYVVADEDIGAGFAAAQEVWGQHATAISVLQVAGLARPDCLVEIDALAQIHGNAA